MIYSMTAFASLIRECDFGTLTCEIRSINHRYLELGIHLPESLHQLEMMIRESIRDYVKRGKVECNIRYQKSSKSDQSGTVNLDLAQSLCRASEKISEFFTQNTLVSATDILRFPGVFEYQVTDVKQLRDDIKILVDEAMQQLVSARAREGQDLANFCKQKCDGILQQLEIIQKRLPITLKEQKERLAKRFEEAKLELDPMRLEQEMLFYAQKIDVTEEIERLSTHLTEMKRILETGGIVGRRLDFLLQEFNREANTIGSKSVDAILMHAAVEMKVLIEQMREQIQNIE